MKIPDVNFRVINVDKPNILCRCKELLFIGEFDSCEFAADKNLLWLSQNCRMQISGLEVMPYIEDDRRTTNRSILESNIAGIVIYKESVKRKSRKVATINTAPSGLSGSDLKINIVNWTRIRSLSISDKSSKTFLSSLKSMISHSAAPWFCCSNTKVPTKIFKSHFVSKRLNYRITTQCCSKEVAAGREEFTAKDLRVLKGCRLASVTVQNPYFASHDCDSENS